MKFRPRRNTSYTNLKQVSQKRVQRIPHSTTCAVQGGPQGGSVTDGHGEHIQHVAKGLQGERHEDGRVAGQSQGRAAEAAVRGRPQPRPWLLRERYPRARPPGLQPPVPVWRSAQRSIFAEFDSASKNLRPLLLNLAQYGNPLLQAKQPAEMTRKQAGPKIKNELTHFCPLQIRFRAGQFHWTPG